MSAQHTPGPWRWEFNSSHRNLSLVGGRPQYDLTIIDFERWGMNGATMRLRDTAHDGMQLLYRVHERPDWIAPEPGREHHKSWHQLLTHPDARLIAAAPDMLAALIVAREFIRTDRTALADCSIDHEGRMSEDDAAAVADFDKALLQIDAAIQKATGDEA